MRNLIAYLMVSVMCVTSASAQIEISIGDPSFEENSMDHGTYGYPEDPWFGDGFLAYEGIYGFNNIPDGDIAATTSNGAFYQDLTTTYVEGVTYTFSALAAGRTGSGGSLDAWEIALHNATTETELAATTSAFTLIDSSTGPEAWKEISVSYTATAADAGDPIRLYFSTGYEPYSTQNFRFLVDDVSLSKSNEALDVNPTSLTVYEDPSKGPQSNTFTVAILPDPNVKPGQIVTIVVDPNGLGDGDDDVTVNPGILTFTNADWSIPQTVTVTAIGNDDVCDGGFEEIDSIALKVSAVGGDPNDFVGANKAVAVSILDFGCANIIISKTAASVTEGGAGDSYTIEITSALTDPVMISVGAEDFVPASPTDPNLVVGPLPCQVTVNSSNQAILVFDSGNWETPQTITVAAVDDSLYETDPHSYVIGNHLSTDDTTYGAMSVPNVNVTITENDFRSWSFGDDEDLTGLLPNPSFEDPNLSDGAKQVYAGGTTDVIPGFDVQLNEMTVWNPSMSDPNWLNRYNPGHRTVPDGEQILQTAGLSQNYAEHQVPACTYLAEDGPVSYTYKMSVGVAKENDGQSGYALHPDAWINVALGFNPPNEWTLDEHFTYADLLPHEGQWIELEGCLELPAGHPYIGSRLRVLVEGGHVDIDNLQISVSNHPCDGCYQDNYPAGDVTGPNGEPDCKVDLFDFAFIAADWLECNLYPDCITSW